MLVVCRCCEKLIEENQAIKMTMVEYLDFKQRKEGTSIISYGMSAHNIYTQVCRECYKVPVH